MKRTPLVETTFLALSAALLAAGCANRPTPGPAAPAGAMPGPTRIDMEPLYVVVKKRGGKLTSKAYSAKELFESAVRDHRARRYQPALATYTRLLRLFPGARFVPSAHYNIGLLQYYFRRYPIAARHFQTAASGLLRAGKARAAIESLGAAGVSLAEGGDWKASRKLFKRLAARRDITNAQRVEVLARIGLASFKLRDSKARAQLTASIALYTKLKRHERLPTYFVAMAAYYRAAIDHRAFTKAPLRMPAARMQEDVENVARLMTTAKAAYWSAVRYKNPFWGMGAAYQAGSLYRELRRKLLAAPTPKLKSPAERKAYFAQLKAKTKILLRHAITVYQRTLTTADRIGAKNLWVTRTRAALRETQQLYGIQPTENNAGLHRKPHPRPIPIRQSPLLPPGLDPDQFAPALVVL